MQAANNSARLLAGLLSVAKIRRLQIFLEQPAQSQMPNYKPMRKFLQKLAAQKLRVFLGAYDSSMEIPKPLQVWTNSQFGHRLCRLRPEAPADPSSRFYTRGALGQYTGRDTLASTGAYPFAFGKAVIEYYISALPRIHQQLQQLVDADGSDSSSEDDSSMDDIQLENS